MTPQTTMATRYRSFAAIRTGRGALSLCLLALTAGAPVEAADPFTVVVLPDTQNYSEFYPTIYNTQTQWIVDNAASQNIKFVSHVGDIVQNWNKNQEWMRARTAMSILDTAGIPYGTAMGNHDGRTYRASYYLGNFGPQRYVGQSWYGGASPSGLSNYETISAGGRDFLFLHLTIDTPTAELAWAQGILDQNPDKLVAVTTHRYLYDFRVLQGRYWDYDFPTGEGYFEPDGVVSSLLFQDLIKTHKNVFLVLCGHIAGQYHQVSQNDWGLPVFEILQDFDTYTPDGGNGWMRLLTFDVDANQIHVDMYSPWLGRYRLDGPKDTHEDFQHALSLLADPNVVADIAAIVLAIDPNADIEAYLQFLTDSGGQNFWDMAYAAGQRDSSFTLNVDFDAYLPPRYALTISYVNGTWGQVDLAPEPNDPNLPEYAEGIEVTLTAEPIEGRFFAHWDIYDPNFPGDANHVTLDSNNPITFVMNADHEVTAVFKCGSGVGQMLPLSIIALAFCVACSARMCRRSPANGSPEETLISE
ncbi:MAG: metallophosphoesterase [Phycisphaerae bacterium]|nr:metallophosphoesterase [Phycisphaerae bacterium]